MPVGRIYFIQAECGGPIKIGFARDVASRMKGLQTSHHERLVCLVHICGTMDEEQLLHKDYAAYRLEGEWFKDCPEIRALLEHAKAHVTAEGSVAKPATPKSERRPRRRVLTDFKLKMFRACAEEAFGRIGTAKNLARAAGVGQKSAENLLAGKCDPQFDTMTNLFRSSPTMFHWFMATVISGRIQELVGCCEQDAFAILAEFPEMIATLFVSQDIPAGDAAIQAMWNAYKGAPVAICLEYLETFVRDTQIAHRKQFGREAA